MISSVILSERNKAKRLSQGLCSFLKCRMLPTLAAFSTLPTKVAASEKAQWLPFFLANSDLRVMLLTLKTLFCNFLGWIELERLVLSVYILRSGDLILISAE